MRSAKFFLALCLQAASVLLALSSDPGWADDRFVVNCYDAKHDLVQKTLLNQCRGDIITDAEAEAAKERRRAHIRQAYQRPDGRTHNNRRLSGIGSGFFIDGRGTLLTNLHVVEGCGAISVAPASGESADAEMIASDSRSDLALIRSRLKPAAIAAFAMGALSAAPLDVAIIGYPDHGVAPVQPMLVQGKTVSVQKATRDFPVIVFKADVRHGNSGGPLLDGTGNVLGVVFAKIDTVSVYQRTGNVVRDIGLAIPKERVFGFLNASHVNYRTAATGAPLATGALYTSAQSYIARISCWQ